MIITFITLVVFMIAGIVDVSANTTAKQAPEVEWEKTFGGNDNEIGNSVQLSSDAGGYIITGSTSSTANKDVYLIKTDSKGEMFWENTFGDTSSDSGNCVQETKGYCYIITGSTRSAAGDSDVYLIKTDSGSPKWAITFGGTGYDEGHFVQQTKDEGYIIAGTTTSFGAGGMDIYLVKTDSTGSKQWEKKFGGTGNEVGYSVQQTIDGGYIITGYTKSSGAGGMDTYLVKTDSTGNKQWEKTFGGSGDDLGTTVKETNDGGYIITGIINNDACLIKIDADGSKQWEKTFGEAEYDIGTAVQQTKDGGYIVAGYRGKTDYSSLDGYIVKTDADGNKQWEKTVDKSATDYLSSIQQTKDGGYIIAGSIQASNGKYDVYLLKLKPEATVPATPSATPTPSATNSAELPTAARTLNAVAGDKMVDLKWNPIVNAAGLDGFYIYRSTMPDGSNAILANDFPIVATSYIDKNIENGKTYFYYIKAVFSDKAGVKSYGVASNIVSASPSQGKGIMVLVIGNPMMKVNNVDKEIDPGKSTAPVLVNGKTFVPIRAIIETMGGSVSWVGNEQKLVIVLKDKTIELWINSKATKINGVSKEADVAPYISSSGRTMIPFRYAVENLSCDVIWDGPSKSITISFDASASGDQPDVPPTTPLPDSNEDDPTIPGNTTPADWTGIWNTTFGEVKFDAPVGNTITAHYYNNVGKLTGTLSVSENGEIVLKGTYRDGNDEYSGKGFFEFTLSKDKQSFTGFYRDEDDDPDLQVEWSGDRG